MGKTISAVEIRDDVDNLDSRVFERLPNFLDEKENLFASPYCFIFIKVPEIMNLCFPVKPA